ncbi:MAG: VOC family protein [Thermoleophilaceae bacterium]
MALDPRTRIASVTLRVTDPDRVLSLYRDALAIDLDEHPLIRLTADSDAEAPPPRAAGLFHTAIRFPTRESLAEVLVRVARAGFELTGASDHGVSEALYLDDPEGNGVELYWDRPADSWPRHLDGTVAMYTLPLDVRKLAREAGDGKVAPPETDIGHVHLKTTDIPAMVKFWEKGMGMELQALLGNQAAFLSLAGYHHHIGANTWRSHGGEPLPQGALGLERITLEVPDARSLKRGLSGAKKLKAELVGEATVLAPDGIPVELVTASA